MPKIEPMLASAAEVSTPSSTQCTVSIASANSMRSWRSTNGISFVPDLKASRTPDHTPTRLPWASYS
jgi:hypothetical protein